MSSSSNAMTNLPAALKVKPLPSVSTMRVETNVLEPITFSNNGALFVLTNKGILDAGSRLTFSMTCPSGADMHLYGKTGICSLIERATLRIGTTIVAETDSFGQYETIRKQFKTNEELLQKDSVKSGYWASQVDDSGEGLGRLALGRSVDNASGIGSADVPAHLKLSDDVSTTPIYSIGLSELFPMMFSVQLPLFVMQEPVSIELVFKQQQSLAKAASVFGGDLGACSQATGNGDDISLTPNRENCVFIADYLHYDDDRMMETAKIVNGTDKGLIFPYTDLVLTSSTIPAVADPGAAGITNQEIVRDIGLSGQSVNTMVIADTCPQQSASNALLGPYVSTAFRQPDTFNLTINDNVLFNRPVVSETRRQTELAQVFGTDINITMAEYCNNGKRDRNVVATDNPLFSATATLAGHRQDSALQAQNHYNGINLNTDPNNAWGSGQMIGQKPLRITRTLPRSHEDFEGRTMNTWAMCERVFNLKNGQVLVSA
jgi:hypothetical protein